MTTATQNSIHDFENAGLGKAPFRIIGVCDKVGPIRVQRDGVDYMIGSPGQPMGTCKFCGTGIMECWSIRSADGKVFDVGCDCVARTGDKGMKKVIDAHKAKKNREKRHAKGEADAAYLDGVLADAGSMARLASMPHPRASEAAYFANATMADYLEYMRRSCGNAGMGRVAKAIRSALA